MNKQQTSNFSISLLMSDMSDAKRITDIFKQMGIVPHISATENEFIESCEKDLPHFSIVDVKKVSSYFYNHKLLKKGDLALAFFSNTHSKELLKETYKIFNYGVINGQQDMAGQLKSALNRFNYVDHYRTKAVSSSSVQDNYDSKLEKIVDQVQKLKEKNFYHDFFKSLCARLENEKVMAEDFYTAVSRVMGGVKEVKTFTFLELSSSGHKLTSPKIFFDKYKEIPSLWLGKACDSGIEFFAQNMASQVCLELIGGDMMSLLVKGQNENPDLMIFMQLEDDDFIAHFDWESFERYLSGLYSFYEWRDRAASEKIGELSGPWSLYSLVDEMGAGAVSATALDKHFDKYSLVQVDFNQTIQRMFEKPSERFFWKKFHQDFFNGFEAQKKHSFRLFSFGLDSTILLIHEDVEAEVKKDLDQYAKRFPYWRYFEQADQLLSENFVPTIRFINMELMSLMKATRKSDPLDVVGEKEMLSPESLLRGKSTSESMV